MVEEAGAGPNRISGKATASLVLSLLGLIIGPFGCIPGIVCGHVARRQSARDPRIGGGNIALAGLIIGYVFLALMVLVVVVFLTGAVVFSTTEVDGVTITIKPGASSMSETTIDGVTTVTLGATELRLDHMNLLVNGANFGRVNKGDRVRIDRGVVSVNGEMRSPFVSQKQIDALEPKIAARDKLEEPAKLLNLAGADAGKLQEMARQSADAQHMADAVRSTQEAVRMNPDSPKVLAEHLLMLFRAKDFTGVEQSAAGAVDLAIKQDDPETLSGILEVFYRALLADIESYDAGYYPVPPSEKIRALEPLALAERALKAYPDDPRFVMHFLRIHRNVVRYPGGAEAVLERAPRAIREAHRLGYWETACLLGALYFRQLYFALGDTPVPNGTEAAPFQKDDPQALFEMVADAALHLEKEVDLPQDRFLWPPEGAGPVPSMAVAYAGMLLFLPHDLQDASFREIDDTASRFRKLMGMSGDESKKILTYLEMAEETLILRLIRTGEERLIARGVELAKSRQPERSLKETVQHLGVVLERDKATRPLALKLYQQFGFVALPSAPLSDEEGYNDKLRQYRELQKQLASIPDDMAKRAALNSKARNLSDQLIRCCARTGRFKKRLNTPNGSRVWPCAIYLGRGGSIWLSAVSRKSGPALNLIVGRPSPVRLAKKAIRFRDRGTHPQHATWRFRANCSSSAFDPCMRSKRRSSPRSL